MNPEKKERSTWKRLAMALPGVVVYLSCTLLPYGDPSYMPSIGIAAMVIYLWIAEPIPVWISSLLPLILIPLHGILPFAEAAASYYNNTILLFLGGFLLAYSVEKWELHKRIAFRLLALTGDNPRGIIWGMMLSTCLISMWISNTATAIMMLPVAVSIASIVRDHHHRNSRAFFTCMMLGIAYGANIGGIATIVGTPPNIVYKGFSENLAGKEVGFLNWMLLGVPLSLIMLWLTYQLMVNVLFRIRIRSLPEVAELLDRQAEKLGQMKIAEKRSLIIFGAAAFFWIFSQPLNHWLRGAGTGIKIEEYAVAMVFGLLLFAVPSGKRGSKRLLQLNDLNKISWGILVLFGGGMCLAKGLESTGVIRAAGEWISRSQQDNFPALLFLIILSALFLTEIMSNVALAQIYIPVVFGISASLGIENVHTLGIPVTIASSFAFMMPISTPPNAVVYSSGKLKIRDMAMAGFFLNIAGVLLLWFCAMYIIPWLF